MIVAMILRILSFEKINIKSYIIIIIMILSSSYLFLSTIVLGFYPPLQIYTALLPFPQFPDTEQIGWENLSFKQRMNYRFSGAKRRCKKAPPESSDR